MNNNRAKKRSAQVHLLKAAADLHDDGGDLCAAAQLE